MIRNNPARSGITRSLAFFASSMLSWYLGSDAGARWFALIGLGMLCQLAGQEHGDRQALTRVISVLYTIVVIAYIGFEITLKNYLWAVAGILLLVSSIWSVLHTS